MSLFQLYAFVTAAGWDKSLHKRWPDALLVGDYRLLVFTNEDLPKLKGEYSNAVFKEFTLQKTVDAMSAGEIGPFICDLNKAKAIYNHFIPPADED
ncbi:MULTISPECIES: hypothetical protein [unclassified Pseudoalteromonas]|uniref:hypothetical protein n=1 Tax=unclassified Pseudoalteromonas TaxID=194690 RepID=UPI0015FC5622|nr:MULTISPECIES: hypothetical protein [unclassified Pseudoalteromonas]MBB1290967.1 hypothetical protein [Pseudoalteromonas sp. SR41-5]MBB1415331.1 hypothetical protein [Pseudoalteromonas sp. SG43-8]